MVTRNEKREISARLRYTSLLLGISSLSLLSVPALAQSDESAAQSLGDMSYDQALQKLMETKQNSDKAANWTTRKEIVPSNVDPQRFIQQRMTVIDGSTIKPDQVQPIKVEGDLSKAQKVGLNSKTPVNEVPDQQSDGGWNWTNDQQNAAAPQAAEGQEQETAFTEAPVPTPAVGKKTGFTTVFDATGGANPKARTVANQNSEVADESGGIETEIVEEEEQVKPKSAAAVAKDAVAVYNAAVKLHLAGKLDEAVSEYRAALADNPELSQAHCNLGLIFNQQHDYAKAISEFNKALAIDPKDAITYNGLGAAYRAQKDLDGAVKNWSTAVSIDPKLATAHYNLGTVYEIQKNFDKATEAYEEAIKNDFRLGEAHYRLGLILMKKNRTEDAKEQFNKALQVSKNAEYSADARKRLAALEMPAPTR
jgi:tetratricopeptide (TPR) repeat protein